MKVKCIANKLEWPGLFGNKKLKQYSQISIDKEYEVLAVPIIENNTRYASIDCGDIRFLLFNDKGEWQTYPKRLFTSA